MKALSIKQPWAYLIASGIKDIENRTWKTNFRGRIYIHASAKMANFWLTPQSSIVDKEINKISINDYESTTGLFSAIIGEVDIVDCVINHPSIWAEKTPFREADDFMDQADERNYYKNIEPNIKPIYNWVLANPVLYEKPILNVKGKLSFWQTDYQHCEDCNAVEHIETMTSIDECWICKKCTNKLLEHYNKK